MSRSGLADPKGGGSQESNLDFCDQVVNLEEEWVKPLLALNDLQGCQMSKYPSGYECHYAECHYAECRGTQINN
jgi:hypothetical protein